MDLPQDIIYLILSYCDSEDIALASRVKLIDSTTKNNVFHRRANEILPLPLYQDNINYLVVYSVLKSWSESNEKNEKLIQHLTEKPDNTILQTLLSVSPSFEFVTFLWNYFTSEKDRVTMFEFSCNQYPKCAFSATKAMLIAYPNRKKTIDRVYFQLDFTKLLDVLVTVNNTEGIRYYLERCVDSGLTISYSSLVKLATSESYSDSANLIIECLLPCVDKEKELLHSYASFLSRLYDNEKISRSLLKQFPFVTQWCFHGFVAGIVTSKQIEKEYQELALLFIKGFYEAPFPEHPICGLPGFVIQMAAAHWNTEARSYLDIILTKFRNLIPYSSDACFYLAMEFLLPEPHFQETVKIAQSKEVVRSCIDVICNSVYVELNLPSYEHVKENIRWLFTNYPKIAKEVITTIDTGIVHYDYFGEISFVQNASNIHPNYVDIVNQHRDK